MAEIKGLVHGEDNVKFVSLNGGTIDGDLIIDGDLTVDGQIIVPEIVNGIKIVTFEDGTDAEIKAMLDGHYAGKINIEDYWSVGDTRKMHLNAMTKGTGADETHIAQDMTMVIIGLNHDNLKTEINGKTKAAITLQCKEILGDDGWVEDAYIWGSNKLTTNTSNYSNNPRRTWLNNTFINALPSTIQPLVKTVIKKNLADHTSSTAGPNTEDKAFLTSYPEMFGSASCSYYKGSVALEGEQYLYYNSDSKRIKSCNKNGIAGDLDDNYWLRSPSSFGGKAWIEVITDGSSSYNYSDIDNGLAPAFCL